MHELLIPLYQTAQVRAKEAAAVSAGLTEFDLMQRAGQALWRVVQSQLQPTQQLIIMCGAGHNGGDGWVLAQVAHGHGYTLRVISLSPLETLTGLTAEVAQQAVVAGVEWSLWDGHLPACDGIVDAMIGIGLEGPVRPQLIPVIEQINQASVPVIAVDIPSGLVADTGHVYGDAVKADITVTMIVPKVGLYTAYGCELSGQIIVDDLALSDDHEAAVAYAQWQRPAGDWHRPAYSHKGNYGHVWVVGGSRGMGGACLLAAKSAFRMGAGKVTVWTDPVYEASIIAACHSCMTMVDDAINTQPKPSRCTVAVVGPGLGRGERGTRCWAHVVAQKLPMVVDADALYFLHQDAVQLTTHAVMTPHPGEAAMLLDIDTHTVQQNRIDAAQQLAERYHMVCVLKGAGTIVAQPGQLPWVCPLGHPCLAKAGSGDVLAGMIGALMGQGIAPWIAARTAVWVHAHAGQRAAAVMGGMAVMPDELGQFFYCDRDE